MPMPDRLIWYITISGCLTVAGYESMEKLRREYRLLGIAKVALEPKLMEQLLSVRCLA
jgi:hypothetical protein